MGGYQQSTHTRAKGGWGGGFKQAVYCSDWEEGCNKIAERFFNTYLKLMLMNTEIAKLQTRLKIMIQDFN